MAYGRKNTGMRRGMSRGTRRTYRKKTPVPKVKKSTKNYVRSNSKSINSNNRRIMSIERRMKGHLQKSYQEWPIRLSPIATSPICFDMGDYTRNLGAAGQGCAVFNLSLAGITQQVTTFRTQPLCDSTNPCALPCFAAHER